MRKDYIGKKVELVSRGKKVVKEVYEVKEENGVTVGVYCDLNFDSDYRELKDIKLKEEA